MGRTCPRDIIGTSGESAEILVGWDMLQSIYPDSCEFVNVCVANMRHYE